MAFSNSPQYSTYQQKTVPFYMEPLLRSGTTLKDQRFYNCFPESFKTPATDQKTYYIRKRFGLQSIATFAAGEIRGSVTHEGILYWVAGANVFKCDATGFPINIGTLGTTTGAVGMRPFYYNGDDVTYILIADGTTLYQYDTASLAFAVSAAAYPTPHVPFFEVMDGYILMVKKDTSDMYNSQLTDWTQPWDFLSAEMYPDVLIGLQRYNNYIMAVGSESMEMFYNAAIEDGSPFARNDSVIATIGCRSINTALQTDRKFMWLGTTQEGDMSVWSMDEFKPVEIATPAVKMAISQEAFLAQARATIVRVQGHQFYVLCLNASTWAYDVMEKVWHQWTHNSNGTWPCIYGGEVFAGRYYGLANGRILWYNPEAYTDQDGIFIHMHWQTEPMTFDTMNRKFLHRMTLIGDAGAQISVQWSDDDYTTWSVPRVINTSAARPSIVNLGYFRRRAFHFETTAATPVRLEGMELVYNSGVN